MINLTRLNGQEITVNPDQIVSMESTPDTIINFHNGERLLVKESIEDVTRLVVAFKRRINFHGVA